MIQTRKELKFYIQSDRIMAGYEELPFIQKVKHKLISPPILSYLKHMRCCSFYKHHRGGFVNYYLFIIFCGIKNWV